MLPFRVTLRAGEAKAGQIVFAVTRAVLAGEMRPGDRFPSVRTLSRELGINPNTAHAVVTELARSGVLVARPNRGSVVARLIRRESAAAWAQEVAERVAVEARLRGASLAEMTAALRQQWQGLGGSNDAPAGAVPGADGRRSPRRRR